MGISDQRRSAARNAPNVFAQVIRGAKNAGIIIGINANCGKRVAVGNGKAALAGSALDVLLLADGKSAGREKKEIQHHYKSPPTIKVEADVQRVLVGSRAFQGGASSDREDGRNGSNGGFVRQGHLRKCSVVVT